MSARVFNPVIRMSEMRRMLRTGAGGSGSMTLAESGSQSPTAVATLFGREGLDVAKVRRDLFGPVDHEDSRRFVERELAAQQARDSDRWGFDFASGLPRKSGPGTRRYVWQKVTPEENIPEPYALRGMQYISRCTVDEAPTPATTASEVDEATSSVQEVAVSAATTNNMKQSSITDFLKKRKLASCVTKPSSVSEEIEPKKARMS